MKIIPLENNLKITHNINGKLKQASFDSEKVEAFCKYVKQLAYACSISYIRSCINPIEVISLPLSDEHVLYGGYPFACEDKDEEDGQLTYICNTDFILVWENGKFYLEFCRKAMSEYSIKWDITQYVE